MAERSGPRVYTIAAHGGFADALAQGVLDRFGKTDRMALARGLLLLPNNRAKQTLQESFVRLSGGGLLLPRMAAIGDADIAENIGIAIDSLALTQTLPPVVDPMERRLKLAQIIGQARQIAGVAVSEQEAPQLADDFARTLDQLTVEGKQISDLLGAKDENLSEHWKVAYGLFLNVIGQWKEYLLYTGQADVADNRNRIFECLTSHWQNSPPSRFIVAAGITTAAPAVAQLLRTVADLPAGMVVLPNLDVSVDSKEWDALGKLSVPSDTEFRPRAEETHPQFHLKLLLERMGVARGEIRDWRRIGPSAAAAKRSRAINNAFAIPRFTAKWNELPPNDRSLSGVQLAIAATPGDEAQMVAMLVREALEQPEQRISIITPDRELAARIAAHLLRWGIEADDSAGQKLAETPAGVFLLSMIAMAASDFAPVETLTLLKHPLAHAEEERIAWLDQARKLDLLLRGPRPQPGATGIADMIAGDMKGFAREDRKSAAQYWQAVQKDLSELTDQFSKDSGADWGRLINALRNTADRVSQSAIWKGNAGRSVSEWFTKLSEQSALGPAKLSAQDALGYFETLMQDVEVRPTFGGHPRVKIYGLLEARLQQSDLTICCGLNEGIWPQQAKPDPWLAPVIRKHLGLPTLDRQIGLSAHDLVMALGGKRIVLTRSARQGSGPAIASRFVLRMQAMCGSQLQQNEVLPQWAEMLDRRRPGQPCARPAPNPAAERRRVALSVTDVDGLKADPFTFYAKKILGLRKLDILDADPTAAWRGTLVHDVLEHWAKDDDYASEKLLERLDVELAKRSSHPLMRYLWRPRLAKGFVWVGEQIEKNRAEGRVPRLTEEKGTITVDGIPLTGKIDRLDLMPDGSLAIVDYKTGRPPSVKALIEGYSLQLGLLGAIAQQVGFKDVRGTASQFEYWSLAKDKASFGFFSSPHGPNKRTRMEAEEIVDHCLGHLRQAIACWINGSEPFKAKLRPEYAPYTDFDQLMRLDEWYGRMEDGNG